MGKKATQLVGFTSLRPESFAMRHEWYTQSGNSSEVFASKTAVGTHLRKSQFGI
jgi:hypothetical protein